MVSSVGSSVTALAVPFVAVLALHASATQMGVLGASGTASFIVVGLLAGVVVDRARPRTVLVATRLLAGVAVATIPLAAAAGLLRIEQLYAVAFVVGCLEVVDQVAFQALVLWLLGRERLLEGNTTMRVVNGVSEVGGPSVAGVFIQLVTAPVAIVADAVSYVVAAALAFGIRRPEPAPPRAAHGWRIWRDVGEGLDLVLHQPALRAIAVGGAVHNIFSNGALVALYVLYANQVLGLGPAQLGIVFAAGIPGALAGSVLAARYSRRFGMRRALVDMQIVTGAARGFVPLAAFTPYPAVTLAFGELLLGLARGIVNVNQVSLRQEITPDRLQGRMTATIRFLMWSVVPVGALLGGVAADRFGIVPTLAACAAGTTVAALGFLLLPGRPGAAGSSPAAP